MGVRMTNNSFSGFRLTVELKEVSDQRNVSDKGNTAADVVSFLLNQSSKDHRLSAVGSDHALSRGSDDVVNRDRTKIARDGNLGALGRIPLGSRGVHIHDDQTVGSNAWPDPQNQAHFDVFGDHLGSRNAIVHNVGDTSDLAADLNEAIGVVECHDLGTTENLHPVGRLQRTQQQADRITCSTQHKPTIVHARRTAGPHPGC